jgi:hypothetical protein
MMSKILLIGWFLSELTTMYTTLKGIKIKKFIDILNLMSCIKCNSFWVGLLLTGDIWYALAASFIGYLIDKFILSIPIEL